MTPGHLLLITLAVAVTYFFLTWLLSVRINNYGLLDVAWSYGVAIMAPIYALCGTGLPLRKWVGLALGVAWSLRLGTYILRRVIRHHPAEDERYRTLREKWPGKGMFLVFFQLQALLVVVFALPFLLLSQDDRQDLGIAEVVGWSLAILSLAGETLADAQLQKFKNSGPDRTAVCEIGLWRYSRHPNYFFEALIQAAFCLMAWSSPYGWVTILSPLLMLHFLLRVTGIPLTEKHSLESKGEAYRNYQKTTSALVPWFKKSP